MDWHTYSKIKRLMYEHFIFKNSKHYEKVIHDLAESLEL